MIVYGKAADEDSWRLLLEFIRDAGCGQ